MAQPVKERKTIFKIIKRLLAISLILALLAGITFLVHTFLYSLTPFFQYFENKFLSINSTVKTELIGGLSIGALLLALVVFIFPLIIRKTDKKEYLRSFQRGILASTVSYISIHLYQFLSTVSQTFLIIFVAIIIIVGFILIEMILSLKKKEHDISERSKILASIVAGLTFGIILKLLQYAYEWVKKLF